MIVAVTGGTGFLGGHVLRLATEAGHDVRALTRRAQLPLANVEWLRGTLEDHVALGELVDGVDAVIHVAGVVNTHTLAGFVEGNVTGTASLVTATEAAGVRRFIHVSSLSAREPDLSDYGWSKRASEAMVVQSSLDWTIVRPPAIYGAGDREMLELFRIAARRGILPLPPRGRLSLIEAGDLARLLVALVDAPESHAQIYEPDDGAPEGYSHKDFGRMIGAAVGRPKLLTLSTPKPLLQLAAFIERQRLGDKAKLTGDRVRYFCHPDWVVRTRPPQSLWGPQVAAQQGLDDTAAWYRSQGWL